MSWILVISEFFFNLLPNPTWWRQAHPNLRRKSLNWDIAEILPWTWSINDVMGLWPSIPRWKELEWSKISKLSTKENDNWSLFGIYLIQGNYYCKILDRKIWINCMVWIDMVFETLVLKSRARAIFEERFKCNIRRAYHTNYDKFVWLISLQILVKPSLLYFFWSHERGDDNLGIYYGWFSYPFAHEYHGWPASCHVRIFWELVSNQSIHS